MITIRCENANGDRTLSSVELGEVALLLPNTQQAHICVEDVGLVEVRAFRREGNNLVREYDSMYLQSPEHVRLEFSDPPPAALQFLAVRVPEQDDSGDADEDREVEADASDCDGEPG